MLAGAAVPDSETGRAGTLSRWLGIVAAPLGAAMITSGIGYLMLNNTLTQAAALSLPLLLIWVAATGVTRSRRTAQAG